MSNQTGIYIGIGYKTGFEIIPKESAEPLKYFMRGLDGTVKYLSAPGTGTEVPLGELVGNSRIHIACDPNDTGMINTGELFPGCKPSIPNGTVTIRIDTEKMEADKEQRGYILAQGRWGRHLSQEEISDLVRVLVEIGLDKATGLKAYGEKLRTFVNFKTKAM